MKSTDRRYSHVQRLAVVLLLLIAPCIRTSAQQPTDTANSIQNSYLKAMEAERQKRILRKQKMEEFNKSLATIHGLDSTYSRYAKLAKTFSLTPKTADDLAKLKAEEQMLAADLQTNYQKAIDAAAELPAMTERMEDLKQRYISMQVKSKEIQDAKYVPFVDRIKNYIINFAGFAIILMFLNMVKSKIAAFKAARDSTKKYQELLNNQNNEIPTI